MKSLNDKHPVTAANAWGRDVTCNHETFEIEESDVGTSRKNFGGYKPCSVKFERRDVGRKINVMSDGSGWTCWGFV